MSSFHVGIDLGTTNTVMATCKPSKQHFLIPNVSRIYQHLHAKNMGYSAILPSVLFFDQDGNTIVGEYAKFQKERGVFSKVLYNTKLDMGKKVTYQNDFTPVKVASEILKVCYQSIRTGMKTQDDFPNVTITVPASFSQSQIADTIEAAKLAGFSPESIQILEEPIAALLYYINLQIMSGEEETIDFKTKKRIMVYDIGGGTCDVCIVDMQIDDNGAYDIKFIATNRYTEFGGNDFDETATIGLLNKLFTRYNIPEDTAKNKEIKNELVSRILPFCEQYKIWYAQQLKLGSEDNIANASYGYINDFFGNNNVKLDITYDEFQEYTKVFFQDNYTHPTRDLTDKMRDKNIIKPVYQILQYLNKVTPNAQQIDCIFLTGGMSEYLPIEKALQEFCNVPIIKTNEPMNAVALGASMYPYLKTHRADNENIINLQDENIDFIDYNRPKLAESIFIDIENKLPVKIIDAEISIPQSGSVDYEFKVSSGGVRFNLFAGLSEYDPEMRILYNYSINFDDIVPPNTLATIRYEINENRFLRMFLDLDDDRQQTYELTVDVSD